MAVGPLRMRAGLHGEVRLKHLTLQDVANIMADGFATPAQALIACPHAPDHLSTEVVDELVGNG